MKLVITDMDGTFLNSQSKVPQENIDAVLHLKNSKIETAICTGRPVSFIGQFIEESGLASKAICCNGAIIADLERKEILSYENIETDIVREITNFCLAKKMDVCAYNEKGVIYFSENSEHVCVFRDYNDYLDSTKSKIERIKLLPLEENLDRFFAEKICKFLVSANGKDDLAVTQNFLSELNGIYYVSSMSDVLDIMTAGVSKGKGVEKLSSLLNISLKDVCVIGDNKNDIPMFSVAGISVCMANGDAEAKKSATFVTTKTNDNGGFAEAVQFALNN